VTKLSVKSFQHNEINTVSVSLPVYCHSSSCRYFKFDFKTLCSPMMPEYGFSCQQWCHCWRWNVFIVRLRCRSRDKVECQCWQTWNWDTDLRDIANISWLYMWQEVHGRYDRHSSGPLTAGWARGNRELQAGIYSYMFEGFSGTRYGGGAFSTIQRLILFCVFTFSFFRLCIFPFRFCLSVFLRLRFSFR